MATRRIHKKWIELDPTNPNALTGKDIWYDESHTLEDILNQKLNAGSPLPFARIGDLSYLPLGITSEYSAVDLYTNSIAYPMIEPDGSLSMLLPVWDGIRSHCIYAISTLADPHQLHFTNIEYRPSFLAIDEYVHSILFVNETSALVLVKNRLNPAVNKFFLVTTNNTLDSQQHQALDVTSILTTNNLLGLLKLDNSNYIGLSIEGHDVHLKILNSSFGIEIDQVVLNRVNDITYIDWEGISYTDVDTRNCLYLYTVDNQDGTYQFYVILGLTVQYQTKTAIGHVIIRGTIDLNNLIISRNTNDGYTFDPNNPDQYPVHANSTLDLYHLAIGKAANNTSFIYYTDNITHFNIALYNKDIPTLLDSFTTLDNNSVIKTYYLTDVNYLGKYFDYVRWIDDDNIITKSYTNYNSEEITDHLIKAHQKSLTERQTIDDYNDSLPTVDNIELFDDHSNLFNAQVYRLTDLGIRDYFLQTEDTVYQVNESDDSLSVVSALPSNFEDQIEAIILLDSDSQSYNEYVYTWYYLHAGYILIAYLLRNASGATLVKTCIARLVGTTLNRISGYISLTSLNSENIRNINSLNSCTVYLDTSNNVLYTIAFSPAFESAYEQAQTAFVLSFNLSTSSIVSRSINNYSLSNKPATSISSWFGPCITSNLSDNTRCLMEYISHTDISDTRNRIISCFNDWLAGTTPSSLYILTIKPPIGFKLYIPETPVLIKGFSDILEPTEVDLEDLFPDPTNKTFYVYIELVNLEPVVRITDVKEHETFSKIQIATIATDNSSISSILTKHGTRLDIYTPSVNPIEYGLVVADQDGVIDRRWFPQMLQADSLLYYNGVSTTVYPRSNSRMYQGVAELNKVDTAVYEVQITFPEEFEHEPTVMVTACDSNNGYTGVGSYSSLTTWYNLEAINITTQGCTIRLRLGSDITGTFYVHWLAIGE